MTEWHVAPDYITNNWTDELFNLMVEKLSERKKREAGALSGKRDYSASPDNRALNPGEAVRQFGELRKMGSKIKVLKAG